MSSLSKHTAEASETARCAPPAATGRVFDVMGLKKRTDALKCLKNSDFFTLSARVCRVGSYAAAPAHEAALAVLKPGRRPSFCVALLSSGAGGGK